MQRSAAEVGGRKHAQGARKPRHLEQQVGHAHTHALVLHVGGSARHQIRVEGDPGMELKPGMPVDVELPLAASATPPR